MSDSEHFRHMWLEATYEDVLAKLTEINSAPALHGDFLKDQLMVVDMYTGLLLSRWPEGPDGPNAHFTPEELVQIRRCAAMTAEEFRAWSLQP